MSSRQTRRSTWPPTSSRASSATHSAAGGVKGKVGEELADDAEFLRKLKPSLIVARAKGKTPTEQAPSAPSGPQLERAEKPKKGGGGVSPWAVLGAAFAVGYLLAKLVDWRGHAHPKY